MSEFAFYMDVLVALETVGAEYMVVGAFGASAYGLSRATHDADIIVDLDDAACDALAAHFPPPRYYADPQQMRDSIRLGMMREQRAMHDQKKQLISLVTMCAPLVT